MHFDSFDVLSFAALHCLTCSFPGAERQFCPLYVWLKDVFQFVILYKCLLLVVNIFNHFTVVLFSEC